jgi:integrase
VWLADQQVRIRCGLWTDPAAGRVTLAEYSSEWLGSKSRLAPSTRALYEGFLRIHILPHLGGLALRDVSPTVVRRWHSRLSTGSISSNTVAKIYRLLKQVMTVAVDDDLIARNPCRIKGGGRERVAERKTPTSDEVTQILDAVDARYTALVAVAAYVGLRFGELAGLQRRHVNPLKHQLTVEQQLANGGGRSGLRPPKTVAGIRTVTMPGFVAVLMESHLDRFTGPSPEAFVFTTVNGATLDHRNFRKREWLPALEDAGVAGFRFHDLRHVAGTTAAASGVPLKALMHRLGHSTVEAALIYQHADNNDEDVIARHIDDAHSR